MTFSKTLISCLIFLFFTLPIYSDDNFPGREKYPDTPFITQSDLHNGYKKGEYTIVDARSKFEFNVIKIKGAVNLPLSSETFEAEAKALAEKTNKPLVFYCNGRRCMKSYKAAIKSKLPNVLVFDAGVFEWSVAHPDASVLLGKSPMNPDDLISTSKLKEHIVPLSQFETLIPEAVLLDVRSLDMRRGSGLFLLADRSVPLDNSKKLERYLTKALNEDKTLLAYDNAGKSVRWLQYHLEKKGIKKYYFMEGGAKYYTYDNH